MLFLASFTVHIAIVRVAILAKIVLSYIMTAFKNWPWERRSAANQPDSSHQPKLPYFLVLVIVRAPNLSIRRSSDLDSLILEMFNSTDSAAPQYMSLGHVPGHESCRHKLSYEPGQAIWTVLKDFIISK
jgi:hypothetical protein